MFDMTKSYFNDIKERPLFAGASITEEATCLSYVDNGDGTIAVQPTGGTSADIFAGFAITDALKIVTEVVLETVTVPSSAPYTVQLKNANVIIAEAYVFNNTASSVMAANCPTPSSGQYCMTTGGLVTFNSAQAAASVNVTYRYTLTAAQVLDKYHARSVNNGAQDYFSSVSVGCEEGEIFTSMYDASQAYTVGGAVYTGAAGKVTSATTSTKQVGIVTKLPNVNDGLLGVLYRTAD